MYDIETEPNSRAKSVELLSFSCGVIFDIDRKEYLEFKDATKMCECLNKASCLVGYNNRYFDDRVLSKYGINQQIRRIDILNCCKKNPGSKGVKWPTLEELMWANFKISKDDCQRSNPEELMQHCRDDVFYTFKLFRLLNGDGIILPERRKTDALITR